jgi:hypothetical protein
MPCVDPSIEFADCLTEKLKPMIDAEVLPRVAEACKHGLQVG